MEHPIVPTPEPSVTTDPLPDLLRRANEMRDRAEANVPGASEQALVALRFILEDIASALTPEPSVTTDPHDSDCEAELTSHGYTPCRCAERQQRRDALAAQAQEIADLRRIVSDTLWMAGRYADGRMSYAVGLYNDARVKAESLGCANRAPVAVDGMAPERTALREELAQVRSRLTAVEQGWQPIETAPKDGTPVLLFADASIQHDSAPKPFFHVSRWVKETREYWIHVSEWAQRRVAEDASHWESWEAPTHWMPLPTSPQTPEDR